jgi:L-aspartate oxidase
VLATGGAGSLYRYTTNPPVATADGPALAFRAGLPLRDMEFVQFHPTALCAEGYPKFLISEAVRGEGAHLVDAQGRRFMPAYHHLAELAPRDIVARAVFTEMRKAGAHCMYLDFSPLGRDRLRQRFPGIIEELHRRGFNPSQHPIPITPAAHYAMGGIEAGINGQTSMPRLYACGECADYGVHGANRLASNSLLDGLVFGRRSALAMAETQSLEETLVREATGLPAASLPALEVRVKETIGEITWRGAGIVRDEQGLGEALRELEELQGEIRWVETAPLGELEAANMCQAAWLIARSALQREESRGAHHRVDFPTPRPEWRRHILLRRAEDQVKVQYQPVEEEAPVPDAN